MREHAGTYERTILLDYSLVVHMAHRRASSRARDPLTY
jgi:hypothetical protein